jgi:DNA-binding ferritin-like protein
VACAQDNLIRQIPRLRESLSALDEEIHSEMSKPDHAETMRIHSKILQLQDKRMNEVEGRLNTLARDGDEKSGLFEQLHHASGARIIAMSETLDLHGELHHATGQRVLGMARQVDENKAGDATGAHARTVDRQLRDLTKAGEISRDLLQNCQERIGDASGASRKAQLAQDAHRQVQSELVDMRQDMSALARKVELAASGSAATRQQQSEVSGLRSACAAPAASAASVSNEALLRQVAVSVIDIQKMLGASSQDVASLGRKVEKMETEMQTSQSNAATFSLLQRDMQSSNRPKKTRS